MNIKPRLTLRIRQRIRSNPDRAAKFIVPCFERMWQAAAHLMKDIWEWSGAREEGAGIVTQRVEVEIVEDSGEDVQGK